MATVYTPGWPGVIWHGKEIAVGESFEVDGPDDERDVQFWLKTGKLSSSQPKPEGEPPPVVEPPPTEGGEGEGEEQPEQQPGAVKPISSREPPSANVGRRTK